MHRRLLLPVMLLLLGAAISDGTRAAIIPLQPAWMSSSTQTGRGEVAFDDRHGVYLNVYDDLRASHVVGVFIGGDGTVLGEEFRISLGAAGRDARAVYSSAGPSDQFLVTFVDPFANIVYGQLVRYTGTGAAGGELVVAAGGSSNFVISASGALPATAYNPTRDEFAVVWQTPGEDAAASVHVRRFAADGTPVGGTATVADAGIGGGGGPEVAFDRGSERYLIAYVVKPGLPGPDTSGAWAVMLDGAGTPVGSPFAVGAVEDAQTANAVALPGSSGFLVVWSAPGVGRRDIKGRRVPADFPSHGTFPVAVSTLMATSGDEEFPDVAYVPSSNSVILVASLATSTPYPGRNAITRMQLDAFGVPAGEVENYDPNVSVPPGNRLYTPRLAVGTGGQFAMRYNRSGAAAVTFFERFSTTPPAPVPFTPPAARTGTMPGDFDGDGHADLVFQNQETGRLTVWALNATQFLRSMAPVPDVPDGPDWRFVAAPDLNDDGSPDILWQNSADGRVRVWFMDYLTRSSTEDIAAVGDPAWWIVGTGDLNGDHRPDLVWRHQTAGWNAVWFMDWTRVLDTQLLSINRVDDTAWRIAGVGDMNGDHRADIVWQHQPAGRQAVWFMDGSTVLDTRLFTSYSASGTPTYVGDVNWRIGAVGHFANGDDRADVMWQQLAYGWIAVWVMDHNAMLTAHNLQGRAAVSDMNLQLVAPR